MDCHHFFEKNRRILWIPGRRKETVRNIKKKREDKDLPGVVR